MKNGLLLVLAAGACVAPAAFAQTSDDTANLPAARPITLNDIQGGDYARTTYGERVDLVVYDPGIGADTGGGFAGPVNSRGAMDDVVFGGPGATGDVVVNGIAWGVWIPAVGFSDQLYMKVSFYDTYDTTLQTVVTPVNDPTTGAGAPVVWNLNIGAGYAAGAGAGLFYADPVTFTGNVTLTDAFIGVDRLVGCKLELFTDAALTVPADGHAVMRRANNTGNVVGTTNVQGYYAGVVANSAINAVSGGTLSGGGRRGTYVALQGTGYAPPRPTREILPALADGVTSSSSSVATGGVKWYTITLNGDATDPFTQFLDADTEGSATDVAIAVFSSVGDLVAFDRDGGSGTNSQLSFGIGRRAAVGDGSQYDGRNYLVGSQGLPAGEYDVAVAPADATFADGWGVASTSAGGTFTLRFNTNVNGTPAAASVLPPITTDLDTGGPITVPGAPIAAVDFAPYQVNWYKVTTCNPATAAEPVGFDMLGSDSFGNTVAVYDSFGALMGSSTAPTGNAPELVFDGTTLALPAGTYYVAHAYNGQDIGTNRWHFRSTAGDNGFAIGGTVNVLWVACGGGCAWQADGCFADYDNSGGIDGDDVIAFFADWDAGASCADADASTGTDGDDVIAFFGAWDAGGIGFPGC
ncbi:MAG: hypothetical protein ACOYN0_16330 [Phycisphaerales bacterium]